MNRPHRSERRHWIVTLAVVLSSCSESFDNPQGLSDSRVPSGSADSGASQEHPLPDAAVDGERTSAATDSGDSGAESSRKDSGSGRSLSDSTSSETSTRDGTSDETSGSTSLDGGHH